MATLTFPLSRIEGHAQAVVEVWDGQVVAAYFQATEVRGFEYLVQGVPAEQMPVIVPRICGVCSTAHHVASVKALEDAYGVTPPPIARTLRELLLLGQLIQNQATSLFVFTMPDRLGLSSLFQMADDDGRGSPAWPPSSGTITQDRPYAGPPPAGDTAGRMPAAQIAQIARAALRVRKIGTDLISLAGGQFIHPVKSVVGGVTSGVSAADAARILAELEAILPIACDLVEYYVEISLAMGERLGTWGDDQPAHYIAAIEQTPIPAKHGGDDILPSRGGDILPSRGDDILSSHYRPNFDGDMLHVLGADSAMLAHFPAREFRRHLAYQDTDYSYAGQTSYQGEVLRANSLARVNMARCLGTLRADAYLARFREAFGQPAHAILLFDLARGIELVYALERATEILQEPLDRGDFEVAYTPRDGEGYGLVEAPRGPLIHHYRIENGRIAGAEFVIPTVHNLLAIERALKVAAERYVTAERVDLELERAVGRVVRAFDPCIACATH